MFKDPIAHIEAIELQTLRAKCILVREIYNNQKGSSKYWAFIVITKELLMCKTKIL